MLEQSLSVVFVASLKAAIHGKYCLGLRAFCIRIVIHETVQPHYFDC